MARNRLEVIRALLAKAENPAASKEEAETYTAKAMHLLALWGIDDAHLAADGKSTDTMTNRIIHVDDPYARAKSSLLHRIAENSNCRAIGLPGQRRTRRRESGSGAGFDVHVFGYASDLERVEMLFTSLLLQATTAITRETPLLAGPTRIKSYRRAFLIGFAITVDERMQAARRRAVDESDATSTALVLVDRADRADAALRAEYPRIVMTSQTASNTGGLGHGMAAGRAADLGGTRVGSTRQHAIGA